MKNARYVIDMAMIVLLPVLMAYSLVGETLHEAAGVLMFALFIAHHIINRAWYRSLPKGKYTARRAARTIVNVLLIVVMIAQPISGILMSKHLFTFIHLPGVSATAREVHLCLAYWGFVLLNIHAGMHMGASMVKLRQRGEGIWRGVNIALTAVSLYGIYAFVRRQLVSYMFLRTAFVFFDFSEPRMYFFIDYIAMMVMFAFAGCLAATKHKKV